MFSSVHWTHVLGRRVTAARRTDQSGTGLAPGSLATNREAVLNLSLPPILGVDSEHSCGSQFRWSVLHLASTAKVSHFWGLNCAKSRPNFYDPETLLLFGFATWALATLASRRLAHV